MFAVFIYVDCYSFILLWSHDYSLKFSLLPFTRFLRPSRSVLQTTILNDWKKKPFISGRFSTLVMMFSSMNTCDKIKDNLKSWALSEIIKIEEAGGPLNALVPCDLGIVFLFDAFSAVDHLLSIFQSPVFLRNEGTFYNQCVSIKWRILALDWSLTQLIYPHVVVFCIFKTAGVHTLLLSCSHLEWSAKTIMWA